MQSEKEDQEIAEACRRLIKHAAVCWNYLYLSQELATEKNKKRRAELNEAIRNGSVATWKHFNLHGRSISRMSEWSIRWAWQFPKIRTGNRTKIGKFKIGSKPRQLWHYKKSYETFLSFV
jgi:hypothetical protein